VTFLAALLSACDKSADTAEAVPITIAITGSKEVYDYDASFFNGIRMAIDDCNQEYKDQGIIAKTVFYDDEYDYEKGLLISKKIADDPKITAVFGSHSFAILDAAAPIFEESGKILIAVNGMMDKSITDKKYKMIFRNTFGEEDMGASLASYAQKQGIDRIAICHSDTEFENYLAAAFCKEGLSSGIKILDITSQLGSEKDFEKLINRWKAINVKGVVVTRDAIKDAFSIASYIRSNAKEMVIYGDFSFDASDMLEEYSEVAEKIVIPTLVPIKKTKHLDDFELRYEKIYKEKPTWWAAHGYDSVRLIVDTAARSGTNDSKIIAEQIHASTGYEGLTGTILFDENGVLDKREPTYSIVKGGKLVSEE
jgi:branched-chain amino acid transport system substrate-binding protein